MEPLGSSNPGLGDVTAQSGGSSGSQGGTGGLGGGRGGGGYEVAFRVSGWGGGVSWVVCKVWVLGNEVFQGGLGGLLYW